MANYSHLTVIIPTFNEGENIGVLIDRLSELYPQVHIIVADDGSRDSTQVLVNTKSLENPRVRLLDRGSQEVHGLTISALDGILASETPFFVVMDGDLQHPPETIADLLKKLGQGFDLVIAAREDIAQKWNFSRILGSKIASFFAKTRLLFNGVQVKDPLTGFFGGNTEKFKPIIQNHWSRFEHQGFKILLDLLKLIPEDFAISGVYFDFAHRDSGESKMNLKITARFFRSLFR